MALEGNDYKCIDELLKALDSLKAPARLEVKIFYLMMSNLEDHNLYSLYGKAGFFAL